MDDRTKLTSSSNGPTPSARRKPVIAIDGPAGAGKSTVTPALARRLGLLFLDTGAMYRAATVALLDAGIARDDAAAVAGEGATQRPGR